jgi:hypothetical protein
MITELDKLPSDITPQDRIIRLKSHQDGFIFSEKRFPAMVSSWGTGKSMSAIERARIHSEKYPKNYGFILRLEQVNNEKSAMIDFEKYLGVNINSKDRYTFPNGSMVDFLYADDLKKKNLNDVNLGWFVIMQAEEFPNDESFQMLRGRIRLAGVPHWGAVVANTNGHNWVWKLWKSNESKDPEFDLYESNSFAMSDILPSDTLADWEKLKTQSPEVYQRFVLNSWEIADDAFVVIGSQFVNLSVGYQLQAKPGFKKRITVCDVAGESEESDETVIYDFENWKVVDQEIYKHRDLMDTVGRCQAHAQKNGSNMICVDKVGIGAGVYSRLAEVFQSGEMEIYGFDGRLNAPAGIDDQTYSNYKTYAWFKAAEDFKNSLVSIPDDEILKRQLVGVNYKYISDKKISLWRKDDIKKKLGESPDRADALIMGLDAVRRAQVLEGKQLMPKSMGWSHPKFRQENIYRRVQYV